LPWSWHLSRRYGWRGGGAVLLPTLLGIAKRARAYGYGGVRDPVHRHGADAGCWASASTTPFFWSKAAAVKAARSSPCCCPQPTTVLSFGLLSFSSTPALAQFGTTLSPASA